MNDDKTQEWDGLDYLPLRDALRLAAERMLIDRIDVNTGGATAHAEEIELHLVALNGSKPDVTILLAPAGGADMGDLRLTVTIQPNETSHRSRAHAGEEA